MCARGYPSAFAVPSGGQIMNSLYSITSGKSKRKEELGESEKLSVYYHDFFDYPLTFADLIKWNTSGNFLPKRYTIPINCQSGCYLLQGREGLIYKRVLRSRISTKKLEIARKASDVLSLIPSIKMVAVTGSLAMGNAGDESDIDLMVIVKKGTLWTTRVVAYLFIWLSGIQTRRPSDKNQIDKLCLNLWMDEADLVWKRQDRNLYTAHEMAQILPLVNRNKAYEKFLYKNKWILKFWPNAVKIRRMQHVVGSMRKRSILHSTFYIPQSIVEKLAFWLQYNHMKLKITREVVTPTRAIFHPQDRGKVVLSRLGLD